MTGKGRLDSMKRYYAENRDKLAADHRQLYADNSTQLSEWKRERRLEISGGCSTVCEMLEKHHDEMQDDPESLSTEFMQSIIGRKCTPG